MTQIYKNKNLLEQDLIKNRNTRETLKKDIMKNDINGKPITYVVTLNSNGDYSPNNLHKLVQKLECLLTERMFRAAKYKNNFSEYFKFYGFFEKNEYGQSHFHLLLYITEEKKQLFKDIVKRKWQNVIESGDVHIMDFNEDLKENLLNYDLKCFHKDEFSGAFIMSGM